jgi:hypothetical protein
MSTKKSIRERRLDAIYNFKNSCNSREQKELLDFFLATASHSKIKDVIEQFGIKVNFQ